MDNKTIEERESEVLISISRNPSFRASLLPYDRSKQEQDEVNKAVKNASTSYELLNDLGFHEFYMPSLYKAVLIELCASAIFVYFHIAIVLAGTRNGSDYPPTAIAILHGILLTMLILSFGRSSGCHINSIITMSCVVTQHMPLFRGMLYVIAQIVGAYFGALCMLASIKESVADSISLGGCNPGTLSVGQALCIEVFTGLIMLVPAYGTAFNDKQREIYGPILPPIVIGFTLIIMLYSVSALGDPPFTPGGFPSMCLGISMAYDKIAPPHEAYKKAWVYWIGPIIAIAVNGVLYGIAPPHHDTMDQSPRQQKETELSSAPTKPKKST